MTQLTGPEPPGSLSNNSRVVLSSLEAQIWDGAAHLAKEERVEEKKDHVYPARHPDSVDFSMIPTATVPSYYIRLGDILMIEGRPCKVNKVYTSPTTGQCRYTGVGLFSNTQHRESSAISWPVSGVMSQTMQSPIFKQYRLRRLEHDYVVAENDQSGEVEIPVHQDPGFLARLHNAIQNQQGSTRVLVLSTGNTELAVDLKFVHASNTNKEQSGYNLRTLARNGDLIGLESAIQQGAMLTTSQPDAKFALFDAIEYHQHEVVHRLIEAGIDVDQEDENGETALGMTVQNSEFDSDMLFLAESLLVNGASPTKTIHGDVVNLLSASAWGRTEEVEHLLKENESLHANKSDLLVNKSDLLGYTALHEAAYFGHYKIVQLLIDKRADVEKAVAFGGNGVLHAVVDRRHQPQNSGEDRSIHCTRNFGQDHTRILELLLHKKAPLNAMRHHDNKTAQELIIDKLRSRDLNDAEMSTYQDMLMILDGSSCQTGSTAWPPETFRFDVQLHARKQIVTQRQTVDFAEFPSFLEKCDKAKKGSWTWIHFPTNNVSSRRNLLSSCCNTHY